MDQSQSPVLRASREVAPYLILDWLAQHSWSIAIVAGDHGIKATARLGELVVEAEGANVGEISLLLRAACLRAEETGTSRSVRTRS